LGTGDTCRHILDNIIEIFTYLKMEEFFFAPRYDISAESETDQNCDLQAESFESLFARCGSELCRSDSNISAGILLHRSGT
jgi:hypothetical protein